MRRGSHRLFFALVRHRIVPHLFANLNGSYQYSKFHGGDVNDESEGFYEFGANLEYQFNPHYFMRMAGMISIISTPICLTAVIRGIRFTSARPPVIN